MLFQREDADLHQGIGHGRVSTLDSTTTKKLCILNSETILV